MDDNPHAIFGGPQNTLADKGHRAIELNGRLFRMPEYVGAWNWPEARFYMQTTARPRWFHRQMMRLILGVRWIEGPAPWNDLSAPEPS